MIYYSAPAYITDEERALRSKLIYYFNPCLKFVLDHYGKERFKQYGFNSCRQTAVLAAAFCQFEFNQNCDIFCYEANFDDIIDGKPVQYAHAYTRLINENHDWLIDISRTTKQLLFTRTSSAIIYPKSPYCPDYKNTEINKSSIKELNWRDMILSEGPEWITGLKPLVLFQQVCQMVSNLQEYLPGDRIKFIRSIYRRFTTLRLERLERDELIT